jgi:DNA primase
MSARAIDVIVDALRDHEQRIAPRGTDKYQAQCPSHDDQNPSLSIAARQDGKGAVLKCHAGCDYRDVLAAVGLTERDLWDDPDMRNVYRPNLDYRYAGGGGKHRRQRPGSRTKKMWRDRDKPDDSLYKVEKLQPKDSLVYLTEGEKACDAIWAMGGVAVSTGGSTRTCDMSPLHGRDVIAIVDRDESGRKWAIKQRDSLAAVPANTLQLMQCAVPLDKADVVEHFDHDLTLAELVPYYLDDPFYLDGCELPRTA